MRGEKREREPWSRGEELRDDRVELGVESCNSTNE